MGVLKRAGAWLCVVLLTVGLLGFAWSMVGHLTVRNPNALKDWLVEADVYEQITDAIIETATEDIKAKQGDGGINIDNPIIQGAVDRAFDGDFIKSQTETVIDKTFAWLQGDEEQLQFLVKLEAAKGTFIDVAGVLAAQRAKDLPTCTSIEQIRNINFLNAQCVPPGFDTARIKTEVENRLTNDREFLEKVSFNAQDIKIGEDERPFPGSPEAKNIQRAYQYSAYAPWVLGVLSLIALSGVVFLSPRKLFGLRRTGATFIITSVLLGISWIALKIGENITVQDIKTPADMEASRTILADLISIVARDIANLLQWFVLAYLLIGLALLIFVGIKRRGEEVKKPKKETTLLDEPEDETTPFDRPNKKPRTSQDKPAPTKKPTARPAQNPRPKQPTRKIQL